MPSIRTSSSSSSAVSLQSTEEATPLLKPSHGHIITEDDSAQLLALGHKPELKRNHTTLSMLGLAFAILNSWTALSASLSLALPSGGPSAVLWGLIVAGVCNLCLAASLAEFLSAYPTAGVRSQFDQILYTQNQTEQVTLKIGTISLGGHGLPARLGTIIKLGLRLDKLFWLGVLSGYRWQLRQPVGPRCFELVKPADLHLCVKEFEPTSYQMLAIHILYTMIALSINTFGNRLLPLFTRSAFIWSVSGVFIISTVLLTFAAPDYQPADFVFRKFINETGWPNEIAWCLGLLQGALALTGYDAVAHMIEEIPNASREGPKIMIYAVLIGMATGFIFLAVLLFCTGDIQEVITAPHGAILAIFYQATKSKAMSICLLVFPVVCLLFGTTTIMTTSSRMLYAFARDNGLPFSHQFSKLHPALHVPLNALLLTTFPVLMLGSLYLISTTALNSFLSASVIALSISYGFPVFLNVLTGRKKLPKDRSFRLGKWTGWICNLVGLGFTLGATVLFMLPPTLPVTKENMNYSFLVFLCVTIVSTFAYLFEGRKSFHGPRVEASEFGQAHDHDHNQGPDYTPGPSAFSNDLELDDDDETRALMHRVLSRNS